MQDDVKAVFHADKETSGGGYAVITENGETWTVSFSALVGGENWPINPPFGFEKRVSAIASKLGLIK